MGDQIIFVRFFPFYTHSFPYSDVLRCNDEHIELALDNLRDAWWSDAKNRDRLQTARIDRARRQLEVELLSNRMHCHILVCDQGESFSKPMQPNDASPQGEIPQSVRASLIRFNATLNTEHRDPTCPPSFEEIATAADWMRPLPPAETRRGVRILSGAGLPPEFSRQRIAAAAAPWSVLPPLEAFHPQHISPRYPIALVESEQLAKDAAAALQVRVSELKRGANESHDLDELEVMFRFANPHFFVVRGMDLTASERAIVKERINRLRCAVERLRQRAEMNCPCLPVVRSFVLRRAVHP